MPGFDPYLAMRRARVAYLEQTGNRHMDKDRVQGVIKQVTGGIKEVAGKLLGDSKTEAEGRAEKASGKIQNAIGGAKDAVRDALPKK
jgi:uncharacterized protein YjbJ (UPF0337 family)